MTIITKGMGAIIKSVKKSSPMANVFEGAVKKLKENPDLSYMKGQLD